MKQKQAEAHTQNVYTRSTRTRSAAAARSTKSKRDRNVVDEKSPFEWIDGVVVERPIHHNAEAKRRRWRRRPASSAGRTGTDTLAVTVTIPVAGANGRCTATAAATAATDPRAQPSLFDATGSKAQTTARAEIETSMSPILFTLEPTTAEHRVDEARRTMAAAIDAKQSLCLRCAVRMPSQPELGPSVPVRAHRRLNDRWSTAVQRLAYLISSARGVCARGVGVVAGTEYCIAEWQPNGLTASVESRKQMRI